MESSENKLKIQGDELTHSERDRVGRLFVRNLQVHFGHPKLENDDAIAIFYNSLSKDIRVYTDETLMKASDFIRRTRDKRTFPTVAECLKACQDVAAALERVAAERKRKTDARNDVWSAARRENADRLFKSYAYEVARYGDKYTARSAVRDGWAWGAWDFMREQERWPNKYEADKIAMDAKKYSSHFADIIRKNRYNPRIKAFARMRRYTSKRLRALAFNLEFSEEMPQLMP